MTVHSVIRARAILRRPMISSMRPAEKLSELEELERILDLDSKHLSHRVLAEIDADSRRFPLYAITLGNPDRDVPAVGFFGGVHGLERIGSDVVLHYLASIVMQLQW